MFIYLFILFFLSFQKVAANTDVIINEFLIHPTDNKEWIELYNPNEIDLSEYWIDDDISFESPEESASKKSLSLLISDNSKYPYIFLSSFLNNNAGGVIVVFDKNGNKVTAAVYDDDPGKDLTIGRSPDGSGELKVLATATKGGANSGVLPTVAPTLTPTSAPTKTPAPTKAPRSTNSSMPTSLPLTQAKSAVLSEVTKNAKKSLEAQTASRGAAPTSILGASDSASPTVKKEKKDMLVKNAQQNSFITSFAIIAGSVCLIVSGVYLFFKNRRDQGGE